MSSITPSSAAVSAYPYLATPFAVSLVLLTWKRALKAGVTVAMFASGAILLMCLLAGQAGLPGGLLLNIWILLGHIGMGIAAYKVVALARS